MLLLLLLLLTVVGAADSNCKLVQTQTANCRLKLQTADSVTEMDPGVSVMGREIIINQHSILCLFTAKRYQTHTKMSSNY